MIQLFTLQNMMMLSSVEMWIVSNVHCAIQICIATTIAGLHSGCSCVCRALTLLLGDRKSIHAIKTCASYPQRFFLGTWPNLVSLRSVQSSAVTSRFMMFYMSRGDTPGEGPWWQLYTAEWYACTLTVSRITYLPGWFSVAFPAVFVFLSVLLLW